MLDSDFYTAAETSRVLGVSISILSVWRRAEKPTGPPFIRYNGRMIRYRKTRVHAYLDAMEQGKRFDRRQGHPSIATQMANAAAKAEG